MWAKDLSDCLPGVVGVQRWRVSGLGSALCYLFAGGCAPICKTGTGGCYYTDQCKDAVSGLVASGTYKKYNFYYKVDSACATTKACGSCTDSACGGTL